MSGMQAHKSTVQAFTWWTNSFICEQEVAVKATNPHQTYLEILLIYCSLALTMYKA